MPPEFSTGWDSETGESRTSAPSAQRSPTLTNMEVRALTRPVEDNSTAVERSLDAALTDPTKTGWRWLDLYLPVDAEELDRIAVALDLDAVAVRGALEDTDVAKLDDFGHHLGVVVHGLSADSVDDLEISEINCFLTADTLVTVRSTASMAVDRLWKELQRSPELGHGGPDELLARLVDLVTRRLVAVVDLLDDHLDGVVERALEAHPQTVAEITALRSSLTEIRRIARPQRNVLLELRRIESSLVSETGRRRFADARDVAEVLLSDLEAARSGLSDALDAYHGAEARRATEVSRVLTIYAAVMFPLTLVVGFFGMNFVQMPLIEKPWGWWVVAIVMAIITLLSLGIFAASGWIQTLSARRAGSAIGKGVAEATRAPVLMVGSLYAAAATPLRRTRRR